MAHDRHSKRAGTIYLIEAVGAFALKVGFTSGPLEKRLRDLQTGSPHELRLVASQSGSKSDERALHETLEDYRIRGEWFDLRGLPVRVLAEQAGGQ